MDYVQRQRDYAFSLRVPPYFPSLEEALRWCIENDWQADLRIMRAHQSLTITRGKRTAVYIPRAVTGTTFAYSVSNMYSITVPPSDPE